MRSTPLGSAWRTRDRRWRGKQQRILSPERHAEWVHACLYLRPYGPRFRAAAQLRAVAKALRPLGKTAALHDPSDRAHGKSGLPDHLNGIPSSIEGGLISIIIIIIISVGGIINFFAWFIEAIINGLRRRGIELIGEVDDAHWHDTFRQAATRSCLIVLDVSGAGFGLSYETDFLRDMGLLTRLVLVQRVSIQSNGDSSADNAIVERLSSGGVDVPCIRYSVWRLGQLTKDLRATAAPFMK